MIPVEFYKTNLDAYNQRHLYRRYVRQRTDQDEKFLFFISDTDPNSPSGRYSSANRGLFDWLDDIILPLEIIQSVRNKKCSIIIDDSIEGFETEWVHPSICNFLNRNQISGEQVYYVTGNTGFDSVTEYNVIRDHFVVEVANQYWNKMYTNTVSQISQQRASQDWLFEFICLQQRPRDFRVTLRNKLRNLYTTQTSVCTMKTGNPGEYIYDSDWIESNPLDSKSQNVYEWWEIEPNNFACSKFAVVSECSYRGLDKKFVTEKTLKNLLFPQPFVLCGYQHQVQDLRNIGFNFYDNIVDHSYDAQDDTTRMDSMIKELDRLINEQVLLDECLEVVNHNKQIANLYKPYKTALERIYYDTDNLSI